MDILNELPVVRVGVRDLEGLVGDPSTDLTKVRLPFPLFFLSSFQHGLMRV